MSINIVVSARDTTIEELEQRLRALVDALCRIQKNHPDVVVNIEVVVN